MKYHKKRERMGGGERKEEGRRGRNKREEGNGRTEGMKLLQKMHMDVGCGFSIYMFLDIRRGELLWESTEAMCNVSCDSNATYVPRRHACAWSPKGRNKTTASSFLKNIIAKTINNQCPLTIKRTDLSNDTEQSTSPHKANSGCNTSITHTKYSV